MSTAPPRDPAVRVPALPRRGARWPGPLFRGVAAVHALLVFAQAVFAGQFLSGDAGALGLHEVNGTEVVTVVALVQVLAAVLVWRPGRGSPLPALVSVLLLAAEVLQIGFGFEGRLAVHVPLGVAILAITVALAVGGGPLTRPRAAT